jgi:uncharacterized protein (DUF427 family)
MTNIKRGEEDDFEALLVGPLVEPTARWVRARFGGVFVADSKRALLLRQYGPGRLPAYYFPQADVRMEALSPGSRVDRGGEISYRTVEVGDRAAANAAMIYANPPESLSVLKGYVSFKWHKMDAWYEEEEEVFVHARDPYKRVDVMPSSRHIRVVIGGQTVAETRRPHLLFETQLPTRYYIPREDVRMELLEPSDLKTRCPYKGLASYWSVTVGDHELRDIVWSYPDPIPENPKIKDLICFFNEKVDLYVDGELLPRPRSPWSE